jgi:hypothetical protein
MSIFFKNKPFELMGKLDIQWILGFVVYLVLGEKVISRRLTVDGF